MATVYLARQDRLTRDVALKVMKPLAMAGDDFTSRFVKEGQIIAQLQHPQIVTIHDFDTTDDGYHYFSMEYLPGGTLADEIKRGLPVGRAIAITRKIAEALAVAHARGVIHRDVKPQNILFRADGTPVLTDFGIARAATRDPDSMQLTSYGMVIGSPRYMSPEQSTGQPLDPRSDLYSLGVVFHEMLTNRLPYEADDVVSLAMKHCNDPIPRLPEHLARYQPVLDRLIAKKPEDRFASAGQLIRALEALEGATGTTSDTDAATRLVRRGDETPSRPEPLPAPAPRRGGRAPWLLALAALLALAIYIAARPPAPGPDPSLTDILDRLPAEPPNRPRTVVQYESLAIEHYRRGQFDQGLEIIRLGLAITADDARLIVLRGLVEQRIAAEQRLQQARRLLAENRLDEALGEIEAGLERVPDHPDLTALRAEVQARIDTRQRLAAERLLELAQTAQRGGDLAEATRLAREGLTLAPDHPALLALLESIAQSQAQERALAETLTRLQELIAAGKASESEEAIARALADHPGEPRLLALREQVQALRTRQRQEAIANIHEQAILRYDQADYPAALALIDEGMRLDPGHAGLKTLREKVIADQRRERQRQADRLAERASALFDRGDRPASLELIDEGLRLDPAHPRLIELRDRILDDQERARRVAEALQGCAARFPDIPASLEASQEAHACYGAILTLAPDDREILDRLARIVAWVVESAERSLSEYRLDAAESTLKSLSAIAPDHPRITALTDDLTRRRSLLPALIEIPGGCFAMGSPASEEGREPDEHPHQVCVEPFRLAPREVSVAQFERFVAASGYRTQAETGTGDLKGCESLDRDDKALPWGMKTWASWRNPNRYRKIDDRDPVSCVSWHDVQAYIDWLNRETGHQFRLPTEAEWEYAARAGTQGARFWGGDEDTPACRHANPADKGQGWDFGFACDDGHEWVAPVGTFAPNGWGLFDMLGNVWEWTCSEYDADYRGAERLCASSQVDSPRVMRGGAWNSGPALVRAAYRNRNFPEARYSFVGFRLAAD